MNRAFLLLLLMGVLNLAIAFFVLVRLEFFVGLTLIAVNCFAGFLVGYMAANAGKTVDH